MKERRDGSRNHALEQHPPVVSVTIPVPGIAPEHFFKDGKLRPGGIMKKIKETLREHGEKGDEERQLVNWSHIAEKVKSGEMSGKFKVTSGAIIIFLAGSGFEFGLRDGKDIKHLLALVHKRRRR